ncbi:MAG: TonB-dependent receptor [Rikenellaceae bacterium]|nr:TonB-dependent receptor [Rikenellaceae bacterium]
MKQTILTLTALLVAAGAFAQSGAELSGNVVNTATGEPIQGVMVTLRENTLRQTTDSRGYFSFGELAEGDEIISFSSAEIISREFRIQLRPGANELPDVRVVVVPRADEMAYASIIDEINMEDDLDGSGAQEVSSLVILSNDIYLNTINWQLSPLYFKVRGYENRYEQRFINGVLFNDQYRGVFNYASIGVLNDMTRNGDDVLYNNSGMFTYGSIGGSQNIDMRAGSYAPGMKVTASYTNSNYYLRGMATYSTGMRDDGWAFTLSAGGRWSDEGNVKGTFYNNFAYGLGVEREVKGGKHSISFTTFGSPVRRGQASASFQEVYDLTGDNLYNPNWGYQNGKKRNSRVVKSYDPTGVLSHIWRIKEDMTLTSGLGVHYNRYGRTSLNWYNGADPRPDYYRNLPSFWNDPQSETNGAYWDVYDIWMRKDASVTQIDWDNLYLANYNSPDGNAVYMVEEQRSDLFEGSFNSTLNAVINDRYKITAGIGGRLTRSYQFKTVEDLMGAQYLLDIDKYEDQGNMTWSDRQSDLNRPDRKVYKGDKFGYNFTIDIKSANAWTHHQYSGALVDFDYSAKLSYTQFQRTGKMRNGHYPENSFGKGQIHRFMDFGFKAGALFKITGRHLIDISAGYETNAPLAYDAYTTAKYSDLTPDNLTSGRIFTADISYIFSMPSLTGRISAFNTNFYDQIIRKSMYYDANNTFVNHIITGANMVNRGFEVGMNYKLNNNVSFDLAGTYAQYYYSNNPMGTISYENGQTEDAYEKVYIKDYYVGQTPQLAGTFGVNIFYNYWFLNVNVNGFTNNYIDIAPIRRLVSNYEALDTGNDKDMEAYRILTTQEKFGGGCTFDLSLGKMLYLKNGQQVNFNATAKNIFNRKNIVRGGFESGRVSTDYPERFAMKYYYMQGINCYINVSYRF